MRRLESIRERTRRWMQRVPGPEAQPVVLPQRRVYVLPTAAGLGVVVMLAVMLLASINYNLSLGYAFTFVVAGCGVAHILMTWRNLVGLSLSVQAEGECFAGGTAHFRLALGSEKAQHRYSIRILSGQTVLLDVEDAGESTVFHRLDLPATRRGHLPVGRLTIETRYPLGWVRAWSYVEPDAGTLVYPQATGDMPLPHASGMSSGTLRNVLPTAEEEFAGLREHRPSDSPSRIAWKRAARDGSLLVKQFAAFDSEDVNLDWDMLPAWMDVETRLSQLTQWLLQAQTANTKMGLKIPGANLLPAQGMPHYRACLERLALFGQP